MKFANRFLVIFIAIIISLQFLGAQEDGQNGSPSFYKFEYLDKSNANVNKSTDNTPDSPKPAAKTTDSQKNDIKTKTITVEDVKYTFCWCPPGEFTMGSPKYELGRFAVEKQHRVKLTKGFWLLESEVTQEMWETVMGTTVIDQARATGKDVYGVGPRYPMFCVNWDECQEFCSRLSEQSGEQITLPTEAQWEYACRAGTESAYATAIAFETMGVYHDNAPKSAEVETIGGYITYFSPSKVKTKRPNHWGLYDMHGNVSEWCSDWKDAYPTSPQTDPTGPEKGTQRVCRGGCYLDDPEYCRSACRDSRLPTDMLNGLGFRIALIPKD